MKSNDIIKVNDNDRQYDFEAVLEEHHISISPVTVETLWVNITRLCNQTCKHCHVDASPQRREQMPHGMIDKCLESLAEYDFCRNVDITGGAPELHPDFGYFVTEARKLNKHVIVRHNITVTYDGNPRNGQKLKHLPEFFAENQVEILASLPHFTRPLVDQVRGEGVFAKSIEGLR